MENMDMYILFINSELFHLILDTAATQNLAVKAQIME
jgi:hypothetical protein